MNIFEVLRRSAARLLFIPRASYASWLTETAFDLAAEGKAEKSKGKLDSARNCIGMPTKEGTVLEIYLLYQLNEYDMAVFKANEFEASVAAIEIASSDANEVNYLLGYTRLILWSIRMRMKESKEAIPLINRCEVNLFSIRAGLKRKFPLVNHVDWKT